MWLFMPFFLPLVLCLQTNEFCSFEPNTAQTNEFCSFKPSCVRPGLATGVLRIGMSFFYNERGLAILKFFITLFMKR